MRPPAGSSCNNALVGLRGGMGRQRVPCLGRCGVHGRGRRRGCNDLGSAGLVRRAGVRASALSKFVTVKNESLPWGSSFIEAVPLGKINVAIDRDGSKYQAKLTARGEVFRGTGQTPVLALQAVLSVIIKSAIKPATSPRLQ